MFRSCRRLALGLALLATLAGFGAPGDPVALGQGAPWDPSQIASALTFWIDAASPATLTLNNGNVAAIASRAGTTVATQSAASSQPGYSRIARNGLPGLTFNGSSQFLNASPIPGLPFGASASTIVIVGYYSGGGAGGYNPVALEYGTGGNGQWRAVQTGHSSGAITYGHFAFDIQSGVSWNAVDHIIYGEVSGGANPLANLWADGTFAGTNTQSAPINTATNSAYIGNDQYNDFWSGALQEILIFNRVLSPDERVRVEGYLAWKWGLQGQLAASHPYRFRRP